MTEQQIARKASLLSKGDFLLPLDTPKPGHPGTPFITAHGLGNYSISRQVIDAEGQVRFIHAADPDGLLERAARRIRRERFSEPPFDSVRQFPVTRRLAYAAFADLRPKNHVQQAPRR